MKRYIWLLIPFFLFSFFNLEAAYLENIPCKLLQPNGDTLYCFVSGDEFYHFYHDENNYTIIQDIETGYYVYAQKRDGVIVPSEHIAGKVDPRMVQLEPRVRKSVAEINEIRKARLVPMEQGRLPYRRSRSVERNRGNMNNIVIFIRFSGDANLTTSFSTVSKMFNDSLPGANSMYNYFKQVSYNQLFIQSHFYPAPSGNTILSYEDIYTRKYYQPYSVTNPTGYSGDTERRNREFALLQRAVNAVKSSIPVGLNIDYNQDGLVDNICFVVKGNVDSWSDLLWPHRWALYDRTVLINGKRVYDFNFQLEGASNYFNNAVLCHEMFHTLGAPDLYHYSDDWRHLVPVGRWDVMETTANPPQNMGAYMKFHYGNWLDSIPEITRYGYYTLSSLGSENKGNKCYKIATADPKQYFVLEYRRTADPFESMVYGSGIVIYRINTNFGGNADYDGVYDFDEVYVFRPGGTPTTNGTITQSFYSSNSGRTQFKIGTNPSPFLTNGTTVDIVIEDISSVGDSIQFRYGPLGGGMVPTPTLFTFQGTAYTPANHEVGTIIGNYLTDSILLTLPATSHFRISVDQLTWSKQIKLPANGANYYVQLNSQTVGEYRDTIVCSSIGFSDVYVRLYGIICGKIDTFPWHEDFEDETMPHCWSEHFENGSVNWLYRSGAYTGSGIDSAHSGSYNAYFAYASFNPYTTKLITPTLDLSNLTNPNLSFWHAQKEWGADIDKLKVYYRISESSPWILLAYFESNIPNWTQQHLSLPNASAYYAIAFEGVNYYGYGVVLDDIVVFDDPPKSMVVADTFFQFTTQIHTIGEIDSTTIVGTHLLTPIQINTFSPFELSVNKINWSQSIQMNPSGGTLYLRYSPIFPQNSCDTIFLYSDTVYQQIYVCGTTLLPSFTLTATADLNGTISPQGNLTVEYGDTLPFYLTPNVGYEISGILIDSIPFVLSDSLPLLLPDSTIGLWENAINRFTFLDIRGNHTISVTFQKLEFVVTATADLNGTISPQGNVTVEYGDTLPFYLTPNVGYEISGILIDSISLLLFDSLSLLLPDSTIGLWENTINRFTFYDIRGNHTILVTFQKLEFTLTAMADVNGTISPQGNVTVEYGDTLQFHIFPNVGYEILGILIDSIPLVLSDSLSLLFPDSTIGLWESSTNRFTFFDIRGNHTILVTFQKLEFTLTATADLNGTISPQGNLTVEYGDTLQFYLTPNVGYEISGILIDSTPFVLSDSLPLLLPDSTIGLWENTINRFAFYDIRGNHTILVTFQKLEFTLTATADLNGTISPQGNVTVEYGDTLQFSLTPNVGYEISGILIDSIPLALSDSLSLLFPDSTIGLWENAINRFTFYDIRGNHTISVTFKKLEFVVTATADLNGTISPQGNITVEYGDTLQFYLTPNVGYEISGILIDSISLLLSDSLPLLLPDSTVGLWENAINRFTFYDIRGNHTISVTFKKLEFVVTATADLNGTISPQGNITVEYGDTLQFSLTPNVGYEISSILIDSISLLLSDSLPLLLPDSTIGLWENAINRFTFYDIRGNHTISVTFQKLKFTVTATADLNGTISPQGNIMVEYGDTLSFSLTPNVGYEISGILIDSISLLLSDSLPLLLPDSTIGLWENTMNRFTFYDIRGNHTISVTFKKLEFVVTATADLNGTISPQGNITVEYGDTLQFYLTPNVGYEISGILIDSIPLLLFDSLSLLLPDSTIGLWENAMNRFTFYDIRGNHTISVTFKKLEFVVTATADGNGAISPQGNITVEYGDTLSFHFFPNVGYEISGILIDSIPLVLSDSLSLLLPDSTLGLWENTINRFTFYNIRGNHTISVTFKKLDFTVTATADLNGTISPQGNVTVEYGDTLSFYLTPNIGYEISSILIDSIAFVLSDSLPLLLPDSTIGLWENTINRFTFFDIRGNHTIYITMRLITTMITEKTRIEYSIYPNPVSTHLHLFFPYYTEINQIQFFNTNGQLIFSTKIENEETILNLGHWKKGVYFLRIISHKKEIWHQTIIKM